MYVDGEVAAAVAWAHFHVGQWMHVHLEASAAFADDVTLMRRMSSAGGSGGSGALKGKLAAVYGWARVLPAAGMYVGAESSRL